MSGIFVYYGVSRSVNKALYIMLHNTHLKGRHFVRFVLFTVYVFTVCYCLAACWRNKG